MPIGIYLQSGANALDVAAAVGKAMQRLSARFPEGLTHNVAFDTTRFVRVSIEEVIKTFAEAVVLVVVVLFLQNLRATIIPVIAVPVSIIGTFAGMYLLGFSINLLTLFGMILVIGIVVNDAIVALENVLAIWLRGIENDVYFQIGLVTLVGLAAKNAILIVEFAVERQRAGLPRMEAAMEAARLRFRPIVMTSLAFILGVLPLAVSTGAGSASRHSIGTGVIGGMLAATFIATLLVPLFFRLFSRGARRRERQAEAASLPAE